MSIGSPQPMISKGRRLALALLGTQSLVTLVIAGSAGLLAGVPAVQSALVGALCSLLPNTVFAVLVFRFSGARAARSVVHSFIAGEAIKILLSVVLLAAAFILFDGPMLPLLVTFAAVHLTHLVAPVLVLKIN